MKYVVIVALAIVVGIPAAARQTQPSDLTVMIAPSGIAGGSAWVVVQSEAYVGGSSAGVGIPGQERTPAAARFSIRAWKEAEKARVVVHAVLEDKRAPEGYTETPIATFTLAVGESRQVPEAEKWGGKPLVVSASLR